MIGTEHKRMVHFGDVVILGGEPEHGNRGNALLAQLRGQSNGRQSFIDGVGGPGKQADLLPGDHRDRSRRAKKSSDSLSPLLARSAATNPARRSSGY